MSITGISGIGSTPYSPNVGNTSTTQSATTLPSSLANLNLTQSQQQQIGQIIQNAENGTISFSQVKSQVASVLNPSQLAQVKSEHHGHRHAHKPSGASSSSTDSATSTSDDDDTDAFGVPSSIPSASSTGIQSISDVAASFWAQSQTYTTE